MSAAELGYVGEFVDDDERALQVIDRPQALAVSNPYTGMAAASFTDAQIKTLARPVTVSEVQLRPDGIAYFPEIYYRRRLNEAFGPGAWALQIVKWAENGETIVAHCRLYVETRFIAEALGEASYIPNNSSYTYATAAESAKSNGLMRCCKDLGIASELWDPTFLKDWLATNAIQVWCTNIGTGQGAGKKKKLWRLKKDPPIDAFPWREGNGENQPKTPPRQQASSPEPTALPQEPVRIDKAMAEKLRQTVTDRKMPPAEATKIFQRHGFAKSTDVTADKFNDVLVALCDWQVPESQVGEPDHELPTPSGNADSAPQTAAPRTEKECLAEKRTEMLEMMGRLSALGVAHQVIEDILDAKAGVRQVKDVTDLYDANAVLVAMETRLEQEQKRATKKK